MTRRSAPDEEPTGARRRRALTEALSVRPDDHVLVVSAEVRNPEHRTRYRVYFPGFPGRDGALCTCPDFARRGLGTCKHLEAAVLALADAPGTWPVGEVSEARVGRLWAEVDRRTQHPQRAEPWTVRVRWPGRALIDPGVDHLPAA